MENTGQQFKKLRTELGLTLEQVAEETRIRSNIITSFEDNNTEGLSIIYFNAYKKTLTDFYAKASNNINYLASIKDAPVENISSKSVPVSPKNQTTSTQYNKNTANLDNKTGNNDNKNIKNDNVNIKNDNKNANLDNKSSFTAVPIDPNALKKDVYKKNIADKDLNAANNIRKKINPSNITKIEEKITPIKEVKQSNFNRKILKNSLNITIKDLIIYISGGIVIAGIIFFVFFYDMVIHNDVEDAVNTDSTATDSVVNITSKEKDIYTYFETDSVVLIARCIDTAWIKVEIDNRKTEELVMMPGMENKWLAEEKITLTTSNVGGIKFYKDDTLLPMLGPKGTMVQNIVLTHDGIKNVNPLTSGNDVVSISELHPNQNIITPSAIDTTKQIKPKQYAKKKKDTVITPIIIDFSKPVTTKPPILEEKKKEEKE